MGLRVPVDGAGTALRITVSAVAALHFTVSAGAALRFTISAVAALHITGGAGTALQHDWRGLQISCERGAPSRAARARRYNSRGAVLDARRRIIECCSLWKRVLGTSARRTNCDPGRLHKFITQAWDWDDLPTGIVSPPCVIWVLYQFLSCRVTLRDLFESTSEALFFG